MYFDKNSDVHIDNDRDAEMFLHKSTEKEQEFIAEEYFQFSMITLSFIFFLFIILSV